MHLNKLYGALSTISMTLIISGCSGADDSLLSSITGNSSLVNAATVNPVTEPSVNPVTDPTVDPVTEPTVDPVTEPTVDPVTEPTVDPVTEPTVDPVTEPTVDTTAPSAPSNIRLASNSPSTTSVELIWNASTDNDGISHYELLRGNTVLSGNISSTNYTDDTVQPNTNYSYVVKAVDLSGNYSLSNAFSVDTPSTDSSQPVVVSTSPSDGADLISLNLEEIIVSFDEAMDPSSLNTSTFTLDNGLTGTVSMLNGNTQAKFIPAENLSRATTYTATLSGVTDTSGNALVPNNQQVYSWTFNTCGDNATSTYTISWDAVNDNDLEAYNVLYGTASPLTKSNSNTLVAGNVTSMTFNPSTLGFKPCDTVHVAVVATGFTKGESALSNIASVMVE